MKKRKYSLILVAVFSFAITAFKQFQTEPWTPDQLLEPSKLAATLNDSNAVKPLIISIGPAGLIKGAIKMGAAKEKDNLDNLKEFLSKEDKNKEIVIYCGCCPFKDCPNIRPAFTLLNKMKFTYHKLLNLPHNLKIDWINYGYPMNN
jgi:hypothetical protein